MVPFRSDGAVPSVVMVAHQMYVMTVVFEHLFANVSVVVIIYVRTNSILAIGIFGYRVQCPVLETRGHYI